MINILSEIPNTETTKNPEEEERGKIKRERVMQDEKKLEPN